MTRFRLNDWQVDPALDTLARGADCIKLDPRPMQVLVLLAQQPGRVLSQRQIEDAVWGDLLVTSNSVYQCITQLRRALGDDAKRPQYIQTVPRKGYRLIATVRWQPEDATSSAAGRPADGIIEHELAVTAAMPPSASRTPRSRWRQIGLVLAILLVAVIGIEAKRIADERALARRERERAEQVSQFMLEVFSAANPFNNLGRPITARELLESRAQHLGADLNEDPLLHAQVLETIGRSYRRQGLYELAVPVLEQALEIRRRTDRMQPQTGSLLAELGVAFHNLGRFSDSDRAFISALEIRSRATQRRSKQYARLLADIGTLELARSHPQRAVQLLEEGLKLLRELPDPDQQQLAAILEDLGQAQLWLDDLAGAERAARAAFEIHRRTLPAMHPDRVLTTYSLGEALRLQDRLAAAEPLLTAALTAQQRLYGAKGAQVARTLDSLALLKFARGQQPQAAQLSRESLAALQADGAAAPDAGDAQLELIRQLLNRADFAAAEQQARTAARTFAGQPQAAQQTAMAEHYLGEALLGQRRLPAAESTLRSAAAHWQQVDSRDWHSALCSSALGEVLLLDGRPKDAEPLLLAAYRAVAVDLVAEPQIKRQIYRRLARLYAATGQQAALLELETGDRETATQQVLHK